MIRLTDEEIQEAADKYAPIWEAGGRQLSKVEILQRQHARLRAVAETQLKKVVERARYNGVIDSDGKVSADSQLHYLFWQALLEEVKE